ncbi:uncharacterized protein LAJ45_09751 [Morchella importuna]|uniref:uncharacterized protein n=1 Tax=Morchella importuna TaxID=1174673 RepID=UPI001E8ECE7E|nr:uncharacterized protein LAJ45_09751 [Morchella importuna]KAH8146308.1 hypothetical protein LAJ45_09751 [Morchella importuna]
MSTATLPKDFLWGYATASAQVEGSPTADGRGLSIWDTFSSLPNVTEDGLSNAIGTNSYSNWAADIALMKSYGVNAHRFSLSWSRIIPAGSATSPLNPAGIAHYQRFMEALLEAGIEPIPTLFHWDLPQALQDEYNGFLSARVLPDFERYARVCFDSFGHLVKSWLTINEPNIFAVLGHCIGAHAPGRSSSGEGARKGDSLKEPYIVGHHLMLAHARAVAVYRKEFAQKQGGKVGIVINGNWAEPWDASEESKQAAENHLTLSTLWLSDPVFTGDYPPLLRKLVGDRLPTFTAEESALLKGSSDFLGLNHYTTFYVRKRVTPIEDGDWQNHFFGENESTTTAPDGTEIGPKAGLSWVRPVPWGFGKLLRFLWRRYDRDVWVTENGVICPGEKDMNKEEALQDDFRIDYFRGYIDELAECVKEGVPVKSYLAWAFADNFEWQEGYTAKFGVTYVDHKNNCEMTPKKSAWWMKEYMAAKMGLKDN